MTDGGDEAALARYAAELADGIEAALAAWVVASVSRVMGASMTEQVRAAAEMAGERARIEVGGMVRRLLETDVDEQVTTPLTLIRQAVRYPTAVLHEMGVVPPRRDDFSAGMFPGDLYDLTPASFADLDAGLAEAGIRWGAAKAFIVKRRHGRPAGGG